MRESKMAAAPVAIPSYLWDWDIDEDGWQTSPSRMVWDSGAFRSNPKVGYINGELWISGNNLATLLGVSLSTIRVKSFRIRNWVDNGSCVKRFYARIVYKTAPTDELEVIQPAAGPGLYTVVSTVDDYPENLTAVKIVTQSSASCEMRLWFDNAYITYEIV